MLPFVGQVVRTRNQVEALHSCPETTLPARHVLVTHAMADILVRRAAPRTFRATLPGSLERQDRIRRPSEPEGTMLLFAWGSNLALP